MSLRLSFPTAAFDGRIHREEELTQARTALQQQQRNATPAVLETPDGAAAMGSVPAAPPSTGRRRVALPDPVAFRFLEGDSAVTVVERRRVLPGYELYLVEQWACSRQSPTLVIATYTGDPKHSVVVGVLEVPADEKDWSPRLKVYFKAIHQYHARPKETEIGELMVTNLSSFPSALTVIAVPGGDIRKHRQEFIINENLKRLGCSGRSGLTLTDPTAATQAKFLQMYKTSDRIPFVEAVLELIKLCQVALFTFGMLEEEYIDGLLCDITEKAVNDWWTEIGSEYFNIEPTDGILGPTTVAALLGTLMGARNRLSYYGAPVSKDVFDIESTKRGIGTFQKSMRLEKTRRLDRQTLLKLHTVTAKAAAGDGGWGVQKAVKSTVAEIGGKRGELVIGMVGGLEKANIGDIETSELGRFVSLAYGERPKWLWHGKPKRTLQDHGHGHPISAFGKELRDEINPQPGTRRTQSAPIEDESSDTKKKEDAPAVHSPPQASNSMPVTVETPGGDRDALRKTVFKSVAGKVSDARSGFGRIRDAVGGGLRGHTSRPSKDETPDTAMSGYSSPSIATLAQSSAAVTSPVAVGKAFSWKVKPEEYMARLKDREGGESAPAIAYPAANGLSGQLAAARNGARLPSEPLKSLEEKEALELALCEMAREVRSTNVSAPGSVVADGDLQGPVLAMERNSDGPLLSLQRCRSIDCIASLDLRPSEARYPRRLSFSAAEDAVLGWGDIINLADALAPTTNLAELRSQAEVAYSMYSRLQLIQAGLAPWVSNKLASVSSLDQTLDAQQSELEALHHAVDEAYQRARHSSGELVAEERARLAEAVKDVEMLAAKLEYEIDALVSRVNEVEDGVAHFETQVEEVERRAEELKGVLETESWVHWFVRTVTGIGTGPNITRGVQSHQGASKREEMP
ncbi:hypothetical protein C8A00DRAFT_41842 [Chaetomidium leptoderma]|uniref:STB6-like N-terminal domain-containing protein n=1 Tax=Chaetomidium leptoderma TaxID=669021 RepID=A0AAN6VPS7_9PEZI|nr:hypothetical protein C8A00DRAFT_41842 [Chaetomidium leptoderma]